MNIQQQQKIVLFLDFISKVLEVELFFLMRKLLEFVQFLRSV